MLIPNSPRMRYRYAAGGMIKETDLTDLTDLKYHPRFTDESPEITDESI